MSMCDSVCVCVCVCLSVCDAVCMCVSVRVCLCLCLCAHCLFSHVCVFVCLPVWSGSLTTAQDEHDMLFATGKFSNVCSVAVSFATNSESVDSQV